MADNTAGPWSGSAAVHTPKAPKLIVLGESISSGHHKDSATAKTVCKDDRYGYAYEFSLKWQASLPVQWRTANQYVNLAWSGFATQRQKASAAAGNVVDGGKDACGRSSGYAPLTKAKQLLAANKNSWNRVVISAGINDTNWMDVAGKIIGLQLLQEYLHSLTPALPGDLAEGDCRSVITGQWNGWRADIKAGLVQGVRRIVSGLRSADASVAVTWIGYFNMSGTGTNQLRAKPYMPATCDRPMQEAIRGLNDTIRGGLPGDVTYIPMSAVMDNNVSRIQSMYLLSGAADVAFKSNNPPGWPHPNAAGAKAIAAVIPTA